LSCLITITPTICTINIVPRPIKTNKNGNSNLDDINFGPKRIINSIITNTIKVKKGYFYSDSTLFYDNCLPVGGDTYLPSNLCNFNDCLSKIEYETMISTMERLRALRIKGMHYDYILEDFILLIDVEYPDYRNSRYLLISSNRPKEFNYTLKIIDKKDNAYLLKPDL
jgi:hypothetical protein